MKSMQITYKKTLEPSAFQAFALVTTPRMVNVHFTATPTEFKIEVWINTVMCDGANVLSDLTHEAEKALLGEVTSYYYGTVMRGRESDTGEVGA